MFEVRIDPLPADEKLDPLSPDERLVTLTGKVTGLKDAPRDPSRCVLIPYVWRFGLVRKNIHEHGWRPAGSQFHYPIVAGDDDDTATWKIDGVATGLQYAVLVVDSAEFPQQHFGPHKPPSTASAFDGPGGRGTLPREGLLCPTAFSVDPPQVRIVTTPDDVLSGVVLGVDRGAPELPDDGVVPRHHISVLHCFRLMAWAQKTEGTFFIGEIRCRLNCYWVFQRIKDSLGKAERYHVALVPKHFDPVSPIPDPGQVIAIDSQAHGPLKAHGAGKRIKPLR